MSRMRSIGEKGAVETVIGHRMAREIARELRARGWAVTIKACLGETPKTLARALWGPMDVAKADRLALTIAEIAGLMPGAGEAE